MVLMDADRMMGRYYTHANDVFGLLIGDTHMGHVANHAVPDGGFTYFAPYASPDAYINVPLDAYCMVGRYYMLGLVADALTFIGPDDAEWADRIHYTGSDRSEPCC